MDLRRIRRGLCEGGSTRRRFAEHGQSMVLVALLLIVFIALLAVTIDGGYAYLQRRNAQTAADAGALAGARELCLTGDTGLAQAAAVNYALVHNRAQAADVVITGGEVQVTARITFDTFFGGVIGRPSITASAVAAANCFAPSSGEGMLPVAWNCPPPQTYVDSNGKTHCDMDTWDDSGGADPPFEMLYIIMNSRKVGESDTGFCMSEGGSVDCDVDGDGEDELLVGGNRSWLDLSGGGGGSSELVDWIRNGYSPGVRIHTWYAGQQGVANNVFIAVRDRLNDRVMLPVFNAISNGVPSPLTYDPPASDDIVYTSGTWTDYFHVISISIFVPICVHATGGDTGCDMYNYFRGEGVLGPDDKTIEGYFVNGTMTGLGGEGDLVAGAYTVYLTE